MLSSNRIGALDIAGAISERIGSYVDLYSIEFLAVENDLIHCWYQSPLADGPVFHIELMRRDGDWALNRSEQLAGSEQQIEIP